MRHLYPLFAVLMLLFAVEEASAQINFYNLDYQDTYNFDSGYYTNGFSPLGETYETANGFRLMGDSTFYRDTDYDPYFPYDNSILGGQLFRLIAYRDFEVGPLPVQVDFSLSEDVKWILSNGQDANPQFEISSRAYVMTETYDGMSLVEPLMLNSVTPNEGRLNGVGILATDHELEVEDYILAPTLYGGYYTLVYELSVFFRHDTLLDDPAAILTVQGGDFSGHNGVEVSLNSSVIAPEPSSFVMAAMGVSSLAWMGWRRKRREMI